MSIQMRDGIVNLLKIAKGNPFLLECRDKKLYIGTYTDYHKVIYETSMNHEDFRAIVSNEIARDIVDLISDDFTVTEEYMEFKNSGNKTKIKLLKEPITLSDLAKGYEKTDTAEFNGKEFKDAFSYVKHASNDKSLGDTVLRGFHLTINSNKAEVMASNGFVMSVVPLQQINENFNQSTILLLNHDFFSVTRLLSDEKVKLGYNENSVSLTCEEESYTIRIITSLTKGNPLPYQRVLSETLPNNKNVYVLDKESFLFSAKQARIFSDSKASIRFYSTGEVDIFSTGDRGETKNSVQVKQYALHTDLEGKNGLLEVKINSDYLLRFIQSVKSDLVSVKLNDEKSPIMFDDNFATEMIAPLLK